VTLDNTLTVAGLTKFDCSGGGAIQINGGTLAAQGNVQVADTNVYYGTTPLHLTGTAAQSITYSGGSGTFSLNTTINKASGTASLATNLSLNATGQVLTVESGTLNMAGYTLTVTGLTINGGTFTQNTGILYATTITQTGGTFTGSSAGIQPAVAGGSITINRTGGTFTEPDSISTSRSGTTGNIAVVDSATFAVGGSLNTSAGADATTGSVNVSAAAIDIDTNVTTGNNGWAYNAGGVTLTASGTLAVDGYIDTRNSNSGGVATRAGAVALTGSSVAVNGNTGGYAITAKGDGAVGSHKGGNNVTIVATGGVSLPTGGIHASGGARGGDVSISNGASGSAGNVTIAGNIITDTNETGYAAGAVTIRGSVIDITGNITALYTTGGIGAYLSPVTIVGSGAVDVDGYISAGRTVNNGILTGSQNVSVTGTSITISGSDSGYGVRSRNECQNDTAGNITLAATAGDIVVTNGLDAHGYNSSKNGIISLSATGNATIGSLNGSLYRYLTLSIGGDLYITGALSNLTITESPKRLTLPANTTLNCDIYYSLANNGLGLSGNYDIYVGGVDTGYDLKEN
jgi:hypothetical protein